MLTNISHFVVLGCSFAYGQGLENPKEQAWPGLISSKFNIPVVNLASKGGGNDRIMRKLFEYHFLDSKHCNNPFYIVAFSHSSRREEYLVEPDDYYVIDMKKNNTSVDGKEFSKPAISNYNQEIATVKKLMLQSYILDFFKANNINYLVTDSCPDTEDDLINAQKLFLPAYNRVYNDPNKLIDFASISCQFTPLECGHDGVEAQNVIAEYLHNEILSRYGKINHINDSFVSLNDYNNYYVRVGTHGGEKDWL